MGIRGEDTGNEDLKMFDRQNFELCDFHQWNVGSVKKTGQIMLGFRRRTLGVVFKTFGYLLSPDDAIRMGESLVSAGVNAKSQRLMEKAAQQGKAIVE